MQIKNLEGTRRAGELFGYPLMIKSKRLAYDGRGNAVAKCEEDISSAVNGMFFVRHAAWVSLLDSCIVLYSYFGKYKKPRNVTVAKCRHFCSPSFYLMRHDRTRYLVGKKCRRFWFSDKCLLISCFHLLTMSSISTKLIA